MNIGRKSTSWGSVCCVMWMSIFLFVGNSWSHCVQEKLFLVCLGFEGAGLCSSAGSGSGHETGHSSSSRTTWRSSAIAVFTISSCSGSSLFRTNSTVLSLSWSTDAASICDDMGGLNEIVFKVNWGHFYHIEGGVGERVRKLRFWFGELFCGSGEEVTVLSVFKLSVLVGCL